MKKIKAVIGANYGDEGKGLLTDYFAYKTKKGLVIRFNGGAQAGHTVTGPSGERHVFGHFCSGSFAGQSGFLSSYFVVNPVTFRKEALLLEAVGYTPELFVDKDCLVSTPFDMMINQIVEISRGEARHGSCGLGFNETIERNLASPFRLNVENLKKKNLTRKKLGEIGKLYIRERLNQLNVYTIPTQFSNLFEEEGIIESYLQDVEFFLSRVKIVNTSIISSYDEIIFEGAQGLLLDQNHKYFPHVTRSNTGIKNVVEIIKKMGYQEETMEIIYATRAYLTRHGQGPFPSELVQKPYPNIIDLTNIPNDFQGSLRFGLLDLNDLASNISDDLKNAVSIKYIPSLAITCLDQLDNGVDYIIDSRKVKSSIDEFLQNAFGLLSINNVYLSYGPSRNFISEYSSNMAKVP